MTVLSAAELVTKQQQQQSSLCKPLPTHTHTHTLSLHPLLRRSSCLRLQGAGPGSAAVSLRGGAGEAEVPREGPVLPGHGRHRPLHPHRLRHAAEPQQVRQEPAPFVLLHCGSHIATQSALTMHRSYVAQPAAAGGGGFVLLRVNPAGCVLPLQDNCGPGESGAALAAGLLQGPVPAAEVPAVGGSAAGQSADTRLRPGTRRVKTLALFLKQRHTKNWVGRGNQHVSFFTITSNEGLCCNAVYSVEIWPFEIKGKSNR